MLNLVDNFTKIIKKLLQKYWLYVVIYFFISFCIAIFLDSGTRGFAFLLAIPLVALGLYLANQRTEALLKQTKTDSDRLLTETFAKSIELIVHKEEAVRQGAIYALGKIAKTNHEELTVIVNTLCSFIRRNEPNIALKYDDVDSKIETEAVIKIKTDIETAIKTIVELSSDFDNENSTKYDLSNIYLPYADFSRAKLINFNLSDAHFYKCIFEKVDFSNSNLISSNFKESNFKGATFNNKTEINQTDFSSAIELTKTMLKDAISNSDTKFPNPSAEQITPPDR